MRDIHLRLEDELYSKVKDGSKLKKVSFNEECNRLLALSLIADNLLSKIEKLILEIEQLSKNVYINKRLLEQLYSDIGLNITDPSKSKNLLEFYKRLRKGKYYD